MGTSDNVGGVPAAVEDAKAGAGADADGDGAPAVGDDVAAAALASALASCKACRDFSILAMTALWSVWIQFSLGDAQAQGGGAYEGGERKKGEGQPKMK